MARHTRSTVRDGRKPGWFYVDNQIIDRYGSEVGAIGIAVYVALARHANRDTGQAFPAYKTLAVSLGIARNTVITAVRRLEAVGLITISQQTDDAGNPINTNIYTLCSIAEHKHESPHQGGAADERGGAVNEPPRAADGRGGCSKRTQGCICCIRT